MRTLVALADSLGLLSSQVLLAAAFTGQLSRLNDFGLDFDAILHLAPPLVRHALLAAAAGGAHAVAALLQAWSPEAFFRTLPLVIRDRLRDIGASAGGAQTSSRRAGSDLVDDVLRRVQPIEFDAITHSAAASGVVEQISSRWHALGALGPSVARQCMCAALALLHAVPIHRTATPLPPSCLLAAMIASTCFFAAAPTAVLLERDPFGELMQAFARFDTAAPAVTAARERLLTLSLMSFGQCGRSLPCDGNAIRAAVAAAAAAPTSVFAEVVGRVVVSTVLCDVVEASVSSVSSEQADDIRRAVQHDGLVSSEKEMQTLAADMAAAGGELMRAGKKLTALFLCAQLTLSEALHCDWAACRSVLSAGHEPCTLLLTRLMRELRPKVDAVAQLTPSVTVAEVVRQRTAVAGDVAAIGRTLCAYTDAVSFVGLAASLSPPSDVGRGKRALCAALYAAALLRAVPSSDASTLCALSAMLVTTATRYAFSNRSNTIEALMAELSGVSQTMALGGVSGGDDECSSGEASARLLPPSMSGVHPAVHESFERWVVRLRHPDGVRVVDVVQMFAELHAIGAEAAGAHAMAGGASRRDWFVGATRFGAASAHRNRWRQFVAETARDRGAPSGVVAHWLASQFLQTIVVEANASAPPPAPAAAPVAGGAVAAGARRTPGELLSPQQQKAILRVRASASTWAPLARAAGSDSVMLAACAAGADARRCCTLGAVTAATLLAARSSESDEALCSDLLRWHRSYGAPPPSSNQPGHYLQAIFNSCTNGALAKPREQRREATVWLEWDAAAVVDCQKDPMAEQVLRFLGLVRCLRCIAE